MSLNKFYIFFIILLNFSLYADIETKITPDSKLFLKNDTVKIQCIITANLNASDFILSNVENENIKGLILKDSKANVEAYSDKNLTQYNLVFTYEIVELGEIDISGIKFTFINSEGKETILTSKDYKIKAVSFKEKYSIYIYIFVSIIIILILFLYIFKKKKEYAKKKQLIEEANKLHLLKEKKEEEILINIRGLSKFIIAGEYKTYCKEFLILFHEYFSCIYPQLKIKPELFEMRTSLLGFFKEPIKSKINKFFELIEEIQFTGQSPLQSDIDRLQVLFKEILAAHKDYEQK